MKKAVIALLVVIIALNITSCNNKSSEIVIGLNYEGSGTLSSYGRAMLNGARLAVEKINSAGGVCGATLRLESADNRSIGADSAAAVLYLKSVKKADVIIGPATSTLAKAALSADAGLTMITPSATSDELSGKFVRVCFADSVQGSAMAKWANDKGFRRAAVITDMSSDYSFGCAKAFREAFSGEIVFEGRFFSGDTDFSTLVTEMSRTLPDCVYLPAYYTEAGLIIRQSREQGIDARFLGGDAMDSPKLPEIIGKREYINGITYTDHFSLDSPEYVKFSQNYLKRFGEAPPAYAALAYDSVMLYCNAVEKIGLNDIQNVENTMRNTFCFNGVTGTMTIKENGDCDKQPVFMSLDTN